LFILNGLTFIFIGLGLRSVMVAIADEPLWWNLSIAISILLVTILVRLLWVFPAAHIPRWVSRSLRERDPSPPASHLWIIGWTGMRGVVSLAAAMALPFDFPKRDLILFIVFGVILGTLVLQSLSLPWMIRSLGIGSLHRPLLEQEMDARLWMLAAASAYLERSADGASENRQDVQYLREHFESHAKRLVARLELELDDIDPDARSRAPVCRKLHLGALDAQRERLAELQKLNIVDDHLAQQLHREIDLEETHLISSSAIHT
jgi:CPA1 family monovalent cation:H+ antiporter